MNKEEIEFNINEDILYQIAMMSYNKYNNQIANANEHIGDMYSRQDIEEMEKCALEYEKHLGEIAIKQLQSQLTKANNKIEKIKKHIEFCKKLFPHEFDWDEQTDYILSIIGEE